MIAACVGERMNRGWTQVAGRGASVTTGQSPRRCPYQERGEPGRAVVFKLLGVLVALYTLRSALAGDVYVKSGPGGRTVTRAGEPRYFWGVIAIYGGLGVALMTVF
jgi:hypothetical protein